LRYRGLTIGLHPLVYEPAEDSFLLAESMAVCGGDRVLDVGTGTGILALLASKRASRVVGVDVNPMAVELAAENARLNGIPNAVFLEGDLFGPVEGRFDLIVFNPPYLPVQEEGLLERSWSGGERGMEVLERFLSGVDGHLEKGGRVLTLVSSLNDLDYVKGVFREHGLSFAVLSERKIPFEMLYAVQSRL